MRFFVSHASRYEYDVPIRLGAHLLRLIPRAAVNAVQRVSVVVDPTPIAWHDELDAWGNTVRHVHFSGTTQHLVVDTELDVVVTPVPPIVYSLPPLPRAPLQDGWEPFCAHDFEPNVATFAHELAAVAGPDPITWLDHACHALFSRFERHERPTGAARTATETLELGSGACRDLAVLFLGLCRSRGLAARFVSGYYQPHSPLAPSPSQLHAWIEVFLGNDGWRGWDPMHGVRVNDAHLALCAGLSQAATMPIDGGFAFEGRVVNSTLTHSVLIGTE